MQSRRRAERISSVEVHGHSRAHVRKNCAEIRGIDADVAGGNCVGVSTGIDTRVAIQYERRRFTIDHLLYRALPTRKRYGGSITRRALETGDPGWSERNAHHSQQCTVSFQVHHAAVNGD